MSFLWHGLTEQGAQVPVQVDAQGRVIAVDGTPGVSYWERTGTKLSPVNTGDSVDIGSGNISLVSDGAINTTRSSFTGTGIRVRNTATDYAGSLLNLGIAEPDGSATTPANFIYCVQTGAAVPAKFTVIDDGSTYINGAVGSSNISLNASGSASFAGNITAANVTFRSADPQFYVKKSKNKDALPEYVGPELDLLAEIARLEALVRHLYETLRITPPAGWPVWDGNDDVLRQLRK